MLLILSPAKALDWTRPVPAALAAQTPTEPRFLARAAALVDILRPMAPQDLARLMDLSDALAQLNAARYGAWVLRHDAETSRQALAAFNGDVYDGLDAPTLSEPAVRWLQAHARILSGLYGVLRPLDWMQAYRLEMGSALPNPAGKDLYAYWRPHVAPALRADLDAAPGEPVLVNLASQEYAKAVDFSALGGRVVTCVFQEERSGRAQIVSFYAKRARGLMARFAADNAVQRVDDLRAFNLAGYAWVAAASDTDRWVFRRPYPA